LADGLDGMIHVDGRADGFVGGFSVIQEDLCIADQWQTAVRSREAIPCDGCIQHFIDVIASRCTGKYGVLGLSDGRIIIGIQVGQDRSRRVLP
jgi:hypothetical protein